MGVESKIFLIRDFRLENGSVLPQVKISYETYGRLASNGRNGVLVTDNCHDIVNSFNCQ